MISSRKWAIRFILGVCALLATAILPGCNSSSRGASADLILHNGNFWTVDESHPTVQAVAITGDRFTAIGSDSEILRDDDIERMGRLGIVAEVQPYHISDDMRWMEERIGHERCRGAYAFRSIQESGAILTFGTDWPRTSAAEYPINPMLGLYAAVTRQTVSGDPPKGWFPEESLGIRDAIRAYTYNSAYANFDESLMGSIAVGKLADLAVLSRNLLEIKPREILETETLYTVVGGRIVYKKEQRQH